MIDWIKRAMGMVVTPSIDHLTTYRAKVVAQSGNTVDVVADDPRIGSASKVPILLGLPDCSVAIAVGCYVRLGWRGGDPRQPYVTSWESGASLTELKIHGGTKGAARKDDQVKVTIPAGTVIVAVSGGAGAAAVGTPNPDPIELTGTITAGSGVVKVG